MLIIDGKNNTATRRGLNTPGKPSLSTPNPAEGTTSDRDIVLFSFCPLRSESGKRPFSRLVRFWL